MPVVSIGQQPRIGSQKRKKEKGKGLPAMPGTDPRDRAVEAPEPVSAP